MIDAAKTFKTDMLPSHMQDTVIGYLMDGKPVGGFLRAVLEDSLVESFAHADSINSAFISAWAEWLYNHVPLSAWGSGEKVDKWIEAGGINGRNRKLEGTK